MGREVEELRDSQDAEQKPVEDGQAESSEERSRAAERAAEAEKRFAERLRKDEQLKADQAKVAAMAPDLKASTAMPPQPDNQVVARNQIYRKMEREIDKIRSNEAQATYVLSVTRAGDITHSIHMEGNQMTLYTLIAALEEAKMDALRHLHDMKMRQHLQAQAEQQASGLGRQ